MTASASPPSAPDLDDPGLTELLRAFRQLQLQHGRVIVHQSEALHMGATDIRALFFIASGDDGATPKQVAEFLELSTGATTSLVDRLEAAGTLVRRAHPTDRRSIVLHVTDAGHDVVHSISDIYLFALSAAIPAESYDQMAEVFRRISAALTEGSGCFSTVS
jgi:DNA-binding MarR family transcriptional regulator